MSDSQTTAPRMTPTQAMAVDELRKLAGDHWHGWGGGMGKYNVALRALMMRAPDFIERKVYEQTGEEWWRLKNV